MKNDIAYLQDSNDSVNYTARRVRLAVIDK